MSGKERIQNRSETKKTEKRKEGNIVFSFPFSSFVSFFSIFRFLVCTSDFFFIFFQIPVLILLGQVFQAMNPETADFALVFPILCVSSCMERKVIENKEKEQRRKKNRKERRRRKNSLRDKKKRFHFERKRQKEGKKSKKKEKKKSEKKAKKKVMKKKRKEKNQK